MKKSRALQFLTILIVMILIRAVVHWNIDLSTWTNDERSGVLTVSTIIYVIWREDIFGTA